MLAYIFLQDILFYTSPLVCNNLENNNLKYYYITVVKLLFQKKSLIYAFAFGIGLEIGYVLGFVGNSCLPVEIGL